MPISLSPMMMRQIIMDHYENPTYKRDPKGEGYHSVHMDSTNCVDDIMVYVLEKDGKVIDACFNGVACTISTASTDIMCNLVKDKKIEEALHIIDEYHKMIHEEEYDEEVLDEAIAFMNTSKQAARIKCATIGWDGLKEIIKAHNHVHK